MKPEVDEVPVFTRVRSYIFDGLFGIWTALFAFGIPVFWMLGSPTRPIRAATRIWVRGSLILLKYIIGLTHVVECPKDLPKGPFLIAANHQSPWETMAFLLLFPHVAIVAKQELLKIPVVSWYLARSPMIVIDRESGSAALKLMLKQSLTTIQEGRSVLIFPEGTRKAPDEPVIFRRGIELLYARLKVPVLTVVVNSGRFWGAGVPYKRPGKNTVSILTPIASGLAPEAFRTQLQAVMENERDRTNNDKHYRR